MWICLIYNVAIYKLIYINMAFEVREFQLDLEQDQFLWKFKKANINSSHLDFFSQETSSRSIYHLAQDISAQFDQAIDKINKQVDHKPRTIRKICQKILKTLHINLNSFAQDIEEDKQTLLRYFDKKSLGVGMREQIDSKFKKWIIATWLSISPQQFYLTTDRYMQSLRKDGKRRNSEFEMMNELYVIALGDKSGQPQQEPKQYNQNFILIDINLNTENKYLSESFVWDGEQISNNKIKEFMHYFIQDLLAEHSLQLNDHQIQELQKQARIQMRTQLLYKLLLKKYAVILLNFSSVDIPSDLKEYTITIELKLMNQRGQLIFQDQFQWEILNEANNVEKFVKGLIEDYEIPKKYFSELCYRIRTQINGELEWKFELLVKTFKSIHKDRESPKLNTQTIAVLKKNMTYSMDINLPYHHQHLKLANPYFHNSDLFSLLSRNMDILPEDLKDILLSESKATASEEKKKLREEQRGGLLSTIHIQDNPYLSICGNNYNLHSIWRKKCSS